MQCIKCKIENPNGATRCINCGAELPITPIQNTPFAQPAANIAPNLPAPKKGRKTYFLIAALIIIAIGVSVFFLVANKENSPSAQENTDSGALTDANIWPDYDDEDLYEIHMGLDDNKEILTYKVPTDKTMRVMHAVVYDYDSAWSLDDYLQSEGFAQEILPTTVIITNYEGELSSIWISLDSETLTYDITKHSNKEAPSIEMPDGFECFVLEWESKGYAKELKYYIKYQQEWSIIISASILAENAGELASLTAQEFMNAFLKLVTFK